MKIFIASLLISFSLTSAAQTVSENLSNKEAIGVSASRLSFVLPEGIMSIGIGANSTGSSADVKYTGKNLYSQTISGVSYSTSLAYAYAENSAFVFNLPLTGTQNTEITYGPASTSNGATDKTTNKGMSNPTIGLTGANIGTKYNFKYGISYRPSIMTAKSSTTNVDGNLAESQSQLGTFISIIKKSEQTEFGGTLSFTSNGNGKRENASTGVQSDVSGGNSIGLSLLCQKYFNTETSGVLGLTFNAFADQTSNTTTTKAFNYVSLIVGITHSFQANNNFYAKYEFAPNIAVDFVSGSQNYSGSYTYIGTLTLGSDWYF